MKRYYRYGMANEKDALLESKDFFDGLVIPGHLLAYYPSLETFLSQLGKEWFVDPMTYAFRSPGTTIASAHPKTGDLQLKRSYQRLYERLKLPPEDQSDDPVSQTTLAHDGRMTPNAFMRAGVPQQSWIDDFVASVLSMQRVYQATDEDRLFALLEEEGEDAPQVPDPAFLVSPYWFFDHVGSTGYKWTHDFLDSALEQRQDGERVFAVIAANPRAVIGQLAATIANDFSAADGVLIWLDDFRHEYQDQESIEATRHLIHELTGQGIETHVLYGSELVATMESFGLAGLCSGPGYGESKARSRATGGAPPARYFVPRLMKHLTEDPLHIYLEAIGEVGCPCTQCREKEAKVDTTRPGWAHEFTAGTYFPGTATGVATKQNRENHLKHFTEAMALERNRRSTMTLAQIADEFESWSQALEDSGGRALRDDLSGHLDAWIEFWRQADANANWIESE